MWRGFQLSPDLRCALSPVGDPASSATETAGAPQAVYARNATGLVREVRLIDQVAYNLGSVTDLGLLYRRSLQTEPMSLETQTRSSWSQQGEGVPSDRIVLRGAR
jgi:hypothetical protein